MYTRGFGSENPLEMWATTSDGWTAVISTVDGTVNLDLHTLEGAMSASAPR